MRDVELSRAIRMAAKKQKLTLEELRVKTGLSNGTFYNVLAGKPPRVLRTLEKLKAAGVSLPNGIV